MTAETEIEAARPRRGGRIVGLIVSAAILGAVVVGVGFASSQLEERAAARPGPEPTPPTPVSGVEIEVVDGYGVSARYAGRIEAARQAELSFERAGLIVEIGVDEGDRVSTGDALARLDDRTLNAERARLAAELVRIDAQIDLAERTLDRQRALETSGFASTQRFDEAETQLAADTAARIALEAQIDAIDLEIEKTTLRAPFDGVVARRFLDPGAVVSPGAPALRLIEDGRPQARIGLPPQEAVGLEPGFEAPIESAGVVYVGRLARLRPDLTTETRTVDALFDIERAADAPAPIFGAVARLQIEARVATQGAWTPLQALRAGSSGLWRLMVLEPVDDAAGADGDLRRVVRIDVRLERVEGERAFVAGSLTDGLLVIAEGVNRVSPGQIVRLIEGADRSEIVVAD